MELNNNYFLLRHGQTIYQKNGIKVNYPAGSDPTLSITPEGEEMIKKVAEDLKSENISMIFSSPALRTKQSSEIAGKILAVKEINYDSRLVDINMGVFAGKTHKEYEDFFSSKMERFEKKPEGGENWTDILARLRSFFDDVEKKYKGETILIVSHADPLWLLAGLIKGFKTNEEFFSTRKSGDNLYPDVGELIRI